MDIGNQTAGFKNKTFIRWNVSACDHPEERDLKNIAQYAASFLVQWIILLV